MTLTNKTGNGSSSEDPKFTLTLQLTISVTSVAHLQPGGNLTKDIVNP